MLPDNLQAYYKLDGNSNSSVGSNNGSDTSISYSTSYGYINQGASFNGSPSNIQIALPTNFNNDFILSFRFYSGAEISGWNWFMNFNGYGSTGSGNGGMNIATNSFKLRFSLGAWFNAVPSDYSSQATLSANTWYIVTLTRISNVYRVYVNGSQYGSNTNATSDTFPTSGTFYFGKGPSTDWYGGYLDTVAFWSAGLSASDVSLLGSSGQYPFTVDSKGNFLSLF